MSRILFVSDDADLRAVCARVLARAGWQVTVAAHAGHALLASMETAFDVLVVDDTLADAEGYGLAGQLRRFHPDLRVVRMRNRVIRPFTADDLVDAVLLTAAAIPAV